MFEKPIESGVAGFSAIVQFVNIRWFAAMAICIIIRCVKQKQKAYFADCVKIVGSAQLALLGLRHVYEKGDVGVPLLVVSLLVWASLVLLGIGLLRNDDGGQ
jgi:hypothetical protein